jgi:hypothetical protein
MRTLHASHLLFACLLPVAACSAVSGGNEEGNSDLTINPSGGEQGGKLLVVAPNGVGSAQIMAKRIVTGGTGAPIELTPNESKLVPAGSYCIWTRVDGIDTLPHCEAVNAGASTINVLGSVKFTRSTDDLVFGVDWPSGSKLGQLVGRPDPVPHASGSITLGIDPIRFPNYTFPGLDALRVSFDVAPDAVTTFDLTGADKPALRIVGSQKHQLPNSTLGRDPAASCGTSCYGSDFGYALRLVKPDQGNERPLSSMRLEDLVAGGKSLLVRADQSSTLTLTYQECMNGAWDFGGNSCFPFIGAPDHNAEEAAAMSSPATVVKLGRLEVNKVAFTKLDGTVVSVDGSFDVSFGGSMLYQNLALGTGVDVLPSSVVGLPYTVTIRYKSPSDGTPITDTQQAIVEP